MVLAVFEVFGAEAGPSGSIATMSTGPLSGRVRGFGGTVARLEGKVSTQQHAHAWRCEVHCSPDCREF